MATAAIQVFTGSSAKTSTLPAVSGNTGLALTIKNRGSASLTLDAAGRTTSTRRLRHIDHREGGLGAASGE